jgi:pilus assembly protein Flp/PilA
MGKSMKHYREALKNLLKDDSGQDLIEYALVAGLIGLGSVAAMTSVGGIVGNTFNAVGTSVTNAI